jgi:hypothetical protein
VDQRQRDSLDDLGLPDRAILASTAARMASGELDA